MCYIKYEIEYYVLILNFVGINEGAISNIEGVNEGVFRLFCYNIFY
jgi:hypothetical protein